MLLPADKVPAGCEIINTYLWASFHPENLKIMKQLSYLLLLFTAAWLTSCTSNEEELWIEADGSGRYESTMDLSGIYPFLLMGLQSEDEEGEEEEEDPFTLMMEGLLMSESADTVISFSEVIAKELKEEGRSIESLLDSLEGINPETAGLTEAEKQANIKMVKGLMDMKLRLQINQSESLFKITTINEFDHIENFEQGGNFMETMMGMRDQAEPMGAQAEMVKEMMGAQTQFALDGKRLRVSRRGQDMGDMSAEEKQQMQMVEGMMGDEPYRLTIHFPGKVKKRLDSDYAERVDKQTVVIEIPQEDLKDPDMEMDFGIKFKGLK